MQKVQLLLTQVEQQLCLVAKTLERSQMDYVLPGEVVSDALNAAVKKASLSPSDMLIRGALAGAFLGYATSLVFVALSQGLPGLVE